VPIHEISCAQCGETLRAASLPDLEQAMLRNDWEPYGIHVSAGVAASDRHDKYACRRCSLETPHARVGRLLDRVLLDMNMNSSYDIAGGALDTVVLLRHYGARLHVPSHHRKDADLETSIRTAIELAIARRI
jgi:hypothetical protein